MKQTGLWFLNKLNKEVQVRFLRAFSNSNQAAISVCLLDEYNDFDDFISSAFPWSESEEGFEYWHNLKNNNV